MPQIPNVPVIGGARVTGMHVKTAVRPLVQQINGENVIMPHLLAESDGITTWPLTSLKPDIMLKNMTLTGLYDFGPAIAHAFYEARKAGPFGLSVLFRGALVTRQHMFIPPGIGIVRGSGPNSQTILFDGVAGKPFLCAGNKAGVITRIPVTNVSVAGGRTTLTLATSGHTDKSVLDLAAAWTALDYTTAQGRPVTVDTWGEWFAMWGRIGLTDGTNYARFPVYSFDLAARTITLTGTVGWTPTHVDGPALNSDGVNFTVTTDVIHNLQGLDYVRDLRFDARERGLVRYDVQRGIKGLSDPQSRWSNIIVKEPFTPYLNFDSDSSIDNIVIGGSDEKVTLTSVDSNWRGIQVAATQRGGFFIASDMSQSEWHGRSKGYYLSQGAVSDAECRAMEFEQNCSGFHVPGEMILEDFAGNAFYFNNLNNNISMGNIEINNGGAMGIGAPGTLGGYFMDCNVVGVNRHSRLSQIHLKGRVRTNHGNREGSHVRHLLWLDRPVNDFTSSTPANVGQTGADIARPYLIKDMTLDFKFVNGTGLEVGPDQRVDDRKPLWDSGRADYPNQTYVQLADTPQAIRYRSKLANPTAGLSPATNPDQWLPIGGGRNAWIGGFQEDLIAPTNSGYRFFELWNVVLLINGNRDPSYHQRTISGRPAFTLDPEHDLAKIVIGAAAEARLDVFPGKEGRKQIIRAVDAGSKSVILQPGFRNNGEILNRPLTVPFQTGAVWTATRAGQEFAIQHKEGKVFPLEHEQHEQLGALTALSLNLADFGHTIGIAATSTCAITAPAAADLPAGWWVRVAMTSSAGATLSGVTGASAIAAGASAVLRKVGSTIIAA